MSAPANDMSTWATGSEQCAAEKAVSADYRMRCVLKDGHDGPHASPNRDSLIAQDTQPVVKR